MKTEEQKVLRDMHFHFNQIEEAMKAIPLRSVGGLEGGSLEAGQILMTCIDNGRKAVNELEGSLIAERIGTKKD